MLQKFAASALLALAMGGCAILYPEEKLPPLPQPEAQHVELTKQQGGRFIAFVGPRKQHTEAFLGVSDTNYFTLRSWFDNKTGEVAHQLYVEDSYDGAPYLWDGVHDTDNKKLHFIPISRNQITCELGCAYADEFAVELPEDYLRAHQGGLGIIFTASDGKTLAVTVPPDLVVAELSAVDTVRAVAAKAAANTPTPTPAATAPPAPSGR
jgi:hypothetical protein